MFELPKAWDPRRVAVFRDEKNRFLFRPGQILAGPGDADDVAKVLTDWKHDPKSAAFGVTRFTKTPQNPKDPGKELPAAPAPVRQATAARVAPNHVFVGEAGAITLTGEPRVQGGPGSSVRVAKLPKALPLRNAQTGDGKGVKIAVLDTGLFAHPWLTAVQAAPNAKD